MSTQKKLLQQAQDLVKYCDFTQAGCSRKDNWEDCWAAILREFIESEYNKKALQPKFIKNGDLKRLSGQYCFVDEYSLFCQYRDNLLKYISDDISAIIELGCGSGHNIAYFAEKFPDKRIIGVDWSESAVNILTILSRHYPNISGNKVDLFNGSYLDKSVSSKAAIVTFHTFEQLGDDFGPALNTILNARPQIVIQTEPIFEFYNELNPFDKVAMDYHKKRNYLKGYWPALQRLESDGAIRIHSVKKSEFGSFFHDGYSLLVWEPL